MQHIAYSVKQHSAPSCGSNQVRLGTMKDRPKTAETLSANLRALMKEFKFSKEVLAKRSGVSDRMIGYILAAERSTTIETANDLGKAFGLNGWLLLIPGLPVELAKTGQLEKLIINYAHSSNDGRNYIEKVAEKEADYKAKVK